MSGAGGKADNAGRTILIWSLIIGVFVTIIVVAVAANKDGETTISGGGLFGTQGGDRLVERLDAAADAQRICYGWEIDSDLPTLTGYDDQYRTPGPTPSRRPGELPGFPTPGASATPELSPELAEQLRKLEQSLPDNSVTEAGVDVGSNLGTGVDPRKSPTQCPRWVVFTADYYYSTIDEEWTSVTQGVETNLPLSLSPNDLRRAGITEVDLLGDQANARLADAIGALPMIVAEKGAAPPVPQVAAQTPPAGDRISPPGLARYIWLGVGGVLVAGGLFWIIFAAVRSRRSA